MEAILAGDPSKLGSGRSAKQMSDYKDYRAGVLEEYASLGELLKESALGWDTRLGEDGKKVAFSSEKIPEEQTVFRVNEWPYYLGEGLEHHCIWTTKLPLTSARVEEVLNRERSGYDCCWFVNPPHLK